MSRARDGIVASGADVAIVGAIVIHACGHDIPWYLWAIIAIEILGAVLVRVAEKLGVK